MAPPACTATITKQTSPFGGTGFSFSSAWSGLQGISLNGGQSVTRPVLCGPIFNLYEVPKPGWTLSNVACTVTGGTGVFSIIGANANPAFQPGDTEVNFHSLSPGANLNCTFTNKPTVSTCSITITKKSFPAWGTGFNFSSAWSGLQGISLNNNQSTTKPVPCGPIFNVYEVPKPGWTLAHIACTITGGAGTFSIIGANPNPAFQPGDKEVNFHSLTPGANLKCLYVNKKP